MSIYMRLDAKDLYESFFWYPHTLW
jgi:hypothetical protein